MLKSTLGNGPMGEVIVLAGNHEAALLQFLDNPEQGAKWFRFGGMQTLASYGVAIPSGTLDAKACIRLAARLRVAMGDHLAFVQNLPLSYRSGQVLCVHAGIDPENPDAVDTDTLLWGRARFPETGPVDGLRVVHGHYDAADPVITDGRICVDTGAYYSGRLTAVRLDDDTGVIVAQT
jgi:serine/threonine protein phosphatase 1